MKTLARHTRVLLKIGAVMACLGMAILSPEWRTTLHAQDYGYGNLPPLCEQTCTSESSCSDSCNKSCEFDIDLDTGSRSVSCQTSTCGESGVCREVAAASCPNDFCAMEENCGKSCTDANGFTHSCPSCPSTPSPPTTTSPERPSPPEPPQPPTAGPAPAPTPAPTAPKPDTALSKKFGVPLDTSRNGLYGFDRPFDGPGGAELRDAVMATAAEFGLNPGFLAVNASAEVRARTGLATLVGTGPVKSTAVGLDYWGSHLREAVMKEVPEAKNIVSKQLPERFKNRLGKDTGWVHEFPDGRTALRALAATLRYSEINISRDKKVGANAWNNVPEATRLMIARTYYNGGPRPALELARDAAKGRNVMVTSGPVISIGPKGKEIVHPRRAATIRAAQAAHMSQRFFGKRVE